MLACGFPNAKASGCPAQVLRKRHQLTQEAFAERSGISCKYYQAMESGVKKDLRLTTLERLAKAYKIKVWQLVAPSVPKTIFKSAKRVSSRLISSRAPDNSRQHLREQLAREYTATRPSSSGNVYFWFFRESRV
jgi:transcriptional regulator with XRE-family HTH domain